jgi:hypothetical protein
VTHPSALSVGRRWGMAQHRCTECRKWFTPAATAREHQRVCGPGCRQLRRNRLARRRRSGEVEAWRSDERERQRTRRRAAKEGPCHEPASDGKCSEVLEKLQQIVDKAVDLSRATFRREARQILRKCGAWGGSGLDGAGACHELASERKVAESGDLSGVLLDNVTSQHGFR